MSLLDQMQRLSRFAIFALLAGCASREPVARAPIVSSAPSTTPLRCSGKCTPTETARPVVVATPRASVRWDDCIKHWTIQSCSRTDIIAFEEGTLILTSAGPATGYRTPGNWQWETTKLIQSAPDGDFEATALVESFDGTSGGLAVLFLADAAGGVFLEGSAGGDAQRFQQEVSASGAPTGALGLRGERVQTVPVSDANPRDISGTFTLTRKGNRATITLETSEGTRLTDAVTLPPGSYVVGLGIQPRDLGTTSVRFTEFRAIDRSRKLKTDTFDCSTGESP